MKDPGMSELYCNKDGFYFGFWLHNNLVCFRYPYIYNHSIERLGKTDMEIAIMLNEMFDDSAETGQDIAREKRGQAANLEIVRKYMADNGFTLCLGF